MLKISKQNSAFQFSRQKQFESQNLKLRQEVKAAYQIITRLRGQIEQLKNEVRFLKQQQKATRTKLVTSPKSKSNKSLKITKNFHEQIQIFTSQSDSQIQQYSDFRQVSSVIIPLGKQKTKNVYFQQQKGISSIIKQKNSQIKLRGKATNQKSLKKIDSSSLFHPVSYFDIDPDQDVNFSELLNKNNNKQNFISMNNINISKSQKLINIGGRQQISSAIKQQGKVKKPPQQKIFKKVAIRKPIYDVFFVTGLSKRNQPQILFSFPGDSPHFGPILNLCYSDDFLKLKQGNNQGINLINQSYQGNVGKIKQFYVIPLRKAQKSQKQNLRQYLIVCEVEEIVLVQKQKTFIQCVFQRLYCFISSCQFFNAFKNLINQFLDKINGAKGQNNQYFKEQNFKRLLQQCLQQPLSILSQKSAQQNHTLNYRLDSYISVSIDIPSIQNSYKVVSQYRPWGVLNYKVHIKPLQQYVSGLDTKLFGVLLSYALSQKKIILFSNTKSKISECILHFLQIIKPLQYVCPVLMTALKQDHQQYFSAPMSLILGLWVDQKRMQKQKIEIFMNRRQNLAGMIEKGKIEISDGIIINLDTGLIYGGGLSQGLTTLGLKINEYYENYCHHQKQIFKLFQKIFQKQIHRNESQLMELSQKLRYSLQGTQLYSFYLERRNRKESFF